MKRRTLLAMATMLPWLGACAGTGSYMGSNGQGIGMVVEYQLAPGAATKIGVNAAADTGYRLFGPSRMTTTGGGGTNHLGGAAIPRWVRVTWREGVDEVHGLYWTTGKVIGDYTVPVLERIPPEVFNYAGAAQGRAIVLRFRIKDDGVLLAWDVQETVLHPSGGRGLEYSMHGGDFPCVTSPFQHTPNCTEGSLEQAPWYNPSWIRK